MGPDPWHDVYMETSTETNHLDLAEYAELASYWHGGQSSMLYAIASTGKLQPEGDMVTLWDLVWWAEREADAAVYDAQEADEWGDASELAALRDDLQAWLDDHEPEEEPVE